MKKKFHRKRDQRKALFKILLHNLVINERITTTDEKAKYLKILIEKLISKAKKGELSHLRYLLSKMTKKSAYKLFYEIAPKYKDRTGGYVRIIKLPLRRQKDNAKISLIEFI